MIGKISTSKSKRFGPLKTVLTRFGLALAALTVCNASLAQTNCSPDGLGGTRCSNGGGWQSDGFGGYLGTGQNSA
jgi:hypothetical protein